MALRKFKASQVIDPSLEFEVELMSPAMVDKAYDRYAQLRGAPPPPEQTPSPEQLAALSAVVRAGMLPYVDFSIWGPYSRMAARKLKHSTQVFDPSSMTWRQRELPGPASLAEWSRSWAVFKTAMLLLGVASAEALDGYSAHISQYLTTFASLGHAAWPQVYHADVWMRSDAMSSLARNAVPDANGHIWSDVLSKAVSLACPEAAEFWMREAYHPILLLTARQPPRSGGVLSEWTQDPGDRSGNRKGKKGAKGKGKGAKGKVVKGKGKGKQGKGKGKDAPAKDVSGELCNKFQTGLCTGKTCPYGRKHACKHCGKNHPGNECQG